jgi:hypothetical protein
MEWMKTVRNDFVSERKWVSTNFSIQQLKLFVREDDWKLLRKIQFAKHAARLESSSTQSWVGRKFVEIISEITRAGIGSGVEQSLKIVTF